MCAMRTGRLALRLRRAGRTARRGRISSAQADQILKAAAGLEIELLPPDWGESLPVARKFKRSAYDAAYLRLADRLNEHLITADERLYNAVRPKLKWVQWLGNYRAE
jgi:predicted nucleic acid-binding protein